MSSHDPTLLERRIANLEKLVATKVIDGGDLDVRLGAVEQLYGDLRNDITEYQSTARRRRTELLASMAATIASGLAKDDKLGDLLVAVEIARRILKLAESSGG